MKHSIMIAAFITLTTALVTPWARSVSTNNTLTLPQPTPGESVDQWINQLFGPDDSSFGSANFTFPTNGTPPATDSGLRKPSGTSKRDISESQYREYNGIHELSWFDTIEDSGYNLTVDFSNSCTGLKLSTDVGVYTYANGTTTNSTQLKDLIADIWSLAPTKSDPRRRWANHTATLSQLGLNEANSVLATGFICSNSTPAGALIKAASGDVGLVHNELRHLLSTGKSYWAATILSAGFGAAAGGAMNAGVQYAFTGNVSAESVVSTATVVAMAVLLSGFIMWLHEIGQLDHAAELANERALRGREIIVQNVQLAHWRGLAERVRRQSIDRIADEAASHDVGGYSADGTTTPITGSGRGSTPQDSPGRASRGQGFMCLSDQRAAQALLAVGQMSSDELRLRMMSSVLDNELERMEQGEAGPSNLGQGVSTYSCNWSPRSTQTAAAGSATDLVNIGSKKVGGGRP